MKLIASPFLKHRTTGYSVLKLNNLTEEDPVSGVFEPDAVPPQGVI